MRYTYRSTAMPVSIRITLAQQQSFELQCGNQSRPVDWKDVESLATTADREYFGDGQAHDGHLGSQLAATGRAGPPALPVAGRPGGLAPHRLDQRRNHRAARSGGPASGARSESRHGVASAQARASTLGVTARWQSLSRRAR